MSGLTNELLTVLEDEFGSIETGVKSGGNQSIQLVSYVHEAQRPKFLSTLGLSNIMHPSSEWFMEFSPELSADSAASVLDHYLSLYLSGTISAPKRGSYVVFPEASDRVWKSDHSNGLYFTLPVCRSVNFQKQMNAIGVIPVWVLPITKAEVEILDTKGWRFLEDYWDSQNSDLYSAYRP